MIERLSGLCSSFRYGLPHRTLFDGTTEQHFDATTNQQCRKDWMVSVEPKYYTHKLLNDLKHTYNTT